MLKLICNFASDRVKFILPYQGKRAAIYRCPTFLSEFKQLVFNDIIHIFDVFCRIFFIYIVVIAVTQKIH